jgi:diadenosine tetraphosphate (Ap4A) HIT family hydrolase
MVCQLCDAIKEDFRVILKDSYAFSIVNIEPVKRFHFMVLPIRHVDSLDKLSGDELKSMFGFLDKLERAIIRASGESPLIWMHRGKHPSQPHLHIHIAHSRANLRELISNFENSLLREKRSEKYLTDIKKEISNFILD